MISNDSSEAKKKIEQTGRAGSDDISTIEALYGVKPDSDIKYDNNIMEAAHPNSVVVSPSYDKLNGLVESNIERQNILLHIVNKPVNGLSTQHKYAEKELLLSLVRIGNDLDNQRQEELRALADTCLEQLASKKKLKKQAWVAVGLAVVALIGALWAQQHLPNLSQGLLKDYKRLDDALNAMLTANTDWGVGHSYDNELKADVKGFKDKLAAAMAKYNSLSSVMRDIEKPRDGEELMQLSQQPRGQKVSQAYNELKKLIENMSVFMDQIEKNFKSDVYKARHTQDTGAITNLLEVTHMQGGNTSLVGDDFESVVTAIPPFRSSIAAILKVFENAQSIEEKASSDLASSQAKSQQELGGNNPAESAPVQNVSNKQEKSVEDLDKDSDELSKLLDGLG